jgi:hypothetical protein
MPESTSSGVSASMSDEADIPDELACITAHPAMFTKAEMAAMMKQVLAFALRFGSPWPTRNDPRGAG